MGTEMKCNVFTTMASAEPKQRPLKLRWPFKLSCLEARRRGLSTPASASQWLWLSLGKGCASCQVALFDQRQFPKRNSTESCQPPAPSRWERALQSKRMYRSTYYKNNGKVLLKALSSSFDRLRGLGLTSKWGLWHLGPIILK